MNRQETDALLREYMDYLLEHSDAAHPFWNIEIIRQGIANKWNYIDGCMISAVLSLYDYTGDRKYLDFADAFVGDFVQEDGSIRTYRTDEYNLDNINPAKNLFRLYDLTGKEKYRKALDLVRSQLDTMPRTGAGNFWHKEVYPNQVWLDGLYMAQPFYMEYETRYRGMQGCLDCFRQFRNVEKLMRDDVTGLYYHGYDESRQMYWADPETGLSPNFWLRSIGWFTLGITDTAAAMDESMYYERSFLIRMLGDLAESLLPFQDPSGMFYQIVNRADDPRNYLETSGTALIAAGMLRGVRLGFLPERYREIAETAFYGITEKYLSRNEDGSPRLGGICLVAGLGGPDHRDGSLDYYFSEPIVENDAKGVGPLYLAYTELLRTS
ncbi:MAG: glycoside hydrolase family 88 protein [Lachnospiraceae bacterium]|nr:glycoside hydrolase family 88 protein [Lachnospiraceae bacterium]